MSDTKICLCIVFNHAFLRNIPILERIYRHRFSTIKYIMPFERDDENPDLITVYRGSYNHQGYATDAAPQLKKIDCTHFIFLQDDVLLNPSINENNILERLDVSQSGAFVTQLDSIRRDIASWHWLPGIIWKLYYPRNLLSGSGVDSMDEMLRHLLPVEEARVRMAKYGLTDPVITWSPESLTAATSVFHNIPHFGANQPDNVLEFNRLVVNSLFETAWPKGEIHIPYPFVATAWGADFFILPKNKFDEYQHYCGVMAAASVFAEIAVGTAMLLSVDDVSTANKTGAKFEWDWSEDRTEGGGSLLKYFENDKTFAVHPVKLSALSKIDGLIDKIVEMASTSASLNNKQ